jgi:inosine-uridine nucleoside N-ribohydrolase
MFEMNFFNVIFTNFFFHIPQDWRFNILGAPSNPITDLLNPIEKLCYKNWQTWTPCDAFLVSLFIDPMVVRKLSEHHVTIELHGRHTRGQVVLDHLYKEKANCKVIELIDEELFRNMILETAGHNVV